MYHDHPACPSISGNLEAIDQGLELCKQLDSTSYNHKALPFVQSSIGEHLRHIIDLYFALINQAKIGVVDYDHRRRGALVETDLQTGISETQQIETWLKGLKESDLDKPVTILSEASIASQQVCEVPSTLRRELLFVSSHTIHHFALMKVITTHCKIETNEHLGYAPATATYLRGQA